MLAGFFDVVGRKDFSSKNPQNFLIRKQFEKASVFLKIGPEFQKFFLAFLLAGFSPGLRYYFNSKNQILTKTIKQKLKIMKNGDCHICVTSLMLKFNG